METTDPHRPGRVPASTTTTEDQPQGERHGRAAESPPFRGNRSKWSVASEGQRNT